ncbi:MAG: GDSL-type esterase/lipase family protein [Anaerolineae bacterium]
MASSHPKKTKLSLKAVMALILTGLIFPLMVIEVAAHLIPNLIPPEIKTVFQNSQSEELKGLIPDPTLGYKYRPNLVGFPVPFEGDNGPGSYAVSTVSLGYEGVGFRDDGLQSEPFAVVVGDSYANCASVSMEACWVELLEQQTEQDFANLGVVGYSPQQELAMLKQYGLPLRPKLVLWVFFANDLNDAWRFDQFGSGDTHSGQFWQNPVRAWLARNSALYTLGAFFWYNRHLFANMSQVDSHTAQPDSNLVWWLTNTDREIPEVAEGLALTEAAILAAQQQVQAASSQTKFVVVMIPYREQVYAPLALQPQLDRLNRTLADFCQEYGLTCIDLTLSLRERVKQEAQSIFFQRDIHLNERGNQLVAELMHQQWQNDWK